MEQITGIPSERIKQMEFKMSSEPTFEHLHDICSHA